MIWVQKGMFGEDSYIGSIKHKLEEIRNSNPQIFASEKECVIEFYDVYEGLSKILGDNWKPFIAWFMRAPSPSTISRARRAINEEQRNNGE